jgi:hypothetical protein
MVAHLASPATGLSQLMPTGPTRCSVPFRPCQVSTRKPTPRELFFLIHSYDRTRTHRHPNNLPGEIHTLLFGRRQTKSQRPRPRPQSAAPRSGLWHPGPTGQSPDRCSAPPRLRIIPHGPRPPAVSTSSPRLPPPHDARNRSGHRRARRRSAPPARARPIRNPSSDLQGSDGGSAPWLLTGRGTRARRPWRAVAGAGAAPRWI